MTAGRCHWTASAATVLKRNRQRIDVDAFPPYGLVTGPMQLAVMDTAHRDRELVADLAGECPRLRKAQMVGVGRVAAAHQALAHALAVVHGRLANCLA